MKAIKYLLVGAAIVTFTTNAVAQDDNTAVIDQVSKIIQSKSPDTADQIKTIFKENKKNAAVITAIGRAYLDEKDTANAQKYADIAIKTDKHYGNAYILEGSIAALKDDGGTATMWYSQAMTMDPKNPEGYRRYAAANSKVDPAGAVATLENLRKVRPDYPVDLLAAEIYDRAGKIDQAIEYYTKVDKSIMEDYQLTAVATDYLLKGEFEKSLNYAQYGAQKFPKYAGLNRVTFYDLTNLKKDEEALTYAEALFNSDKVKILADDYLYYGYAYLGKKDYDNAIAMYEKAIAQDSTNAKNKADALKNISSAYQEKGDFVNAAKFFNEYLNSTKKTAYDLSTLANIYRMQGQAATNAQEKKEALENADKVYEEIENTFPENQDYATYNRALIKTIFDPETKTFLAKPFCEKLVEEIGSKTDLSDGQKVRLGWAHAYIGYYNLSNGNKAVAKENFEKALAADPNNAQAKQLLPIANK